MVTTRPRGRERGYLYVDDLDLFVSSKDDEPARTDAQLRARASLAPLTYSCVPLGSGRRIALDADLDGCFDVTELQAGFDPRDAGSAPPGCESGTQLD